VQYQTYDILPMLGSNEDNTDKGATTGSHLNLCLWQQHRWHSIEQHNENGSDDSDA